MRRVPKRELAYLLAFVVLVAAFPTLARPFIARDVFTQVTTGLASATAVSGGEVDSWARGHEIQATTLAHVARLELDGGAHATPAFGARFGATMDSLARVGDYLHAWVVGPGGAVLAHTRGAPSPGAVRAGTHVLRDADGGTLVDFTSAGADTLRPRVVLRSRLSATAFTRLNPTANRTARTIRTLVLLRAGDSIHAVVLTSTGREPRTRAWLASSAPASLRAASAGATTRGVGTGSAGTPAYYATQVIPRLGLPIVREVEQAEVLTQLRTPVLVQGAFLVALLLALVYLFQSRWQSAQLRREREMMRVRDDFVSSVSHELRTPLTQIRMYAELMRTGSLRSEADRARALNVIEKEARRLAILVDNVLNFSRLRRRTPEANGMVTDIADEVRQVDDAFGPLAAERGMRVRADVPEGLCARVESLALRQLLLNLLENAAKYGPRGQTVTIGAAEAGAMVRIWVDDEGPGVPAGERERIWEPFHRGPPESVADVPGSGIGLAVVRDLVVRHGGQVAVADAPAGGARFEVRFPRASEAEQARTHRAADASDSSAFREPGNLEPSRQ